ncbi:MAG: alpha/beta fold hydrolase [Betaproteobacteria bacterium]
MRSVISFTGVAVLIYLGCCALLFALQRSLIYFPQPAASAMDASMFELPVTGAQVLVTARQRQGPHAVIYFGGNAENVNFSLPGLAEAFPGHALYLLHYRGYGGSSGKPSELALVADALALFDLVRSEHSDIVVVGRSLGSGVAVHVASKRNVANLVLVTPFDSLQDLAASQFPYFPVRWLLLDKFESWRYAASVTSPTLLIAAEHDEIIPRSSSEALHARFREGIASLRVLRGVDHNTVAESKEYVPLLRGLP